MRELRIPRYAVLLAAMCGCQDARENIVGDDEGYRPAPPMVTEVEIPDSLSLTVGGFAIVLHVISLFEDRGIRLMYLAKSSDTTVVTAIIGSSNEKSQYTRQAILNGVGVGEATVTLTAREPYFDILDPRPPRERPRGRFAERSFAVRVSPIPPR